MRRGSVSGCVGGGHPSLPCPARGVVLRLWWKGLRRAVILGRVTRAIPVALLLLLAFGGYIKGSAYLAWLPVDLTLLAGLGVAAYVARSMARSGPATRHRAWLVALLVACLAGLLHTGVAGNDYAASKPLAVFVMAPLCVLGGAHLLRTHTARRGFLVGVAALGFVVLLLARLDPSTLTERLAIDGGNTIGAGRALGAAFVVLTLAAMANRRWRIPLLALAAVEAWGVLATASRGPLLAAAVAVLVVAVLAKSRGRAARISAVAIAGGAIASTVVALETLNPRLSTLSDDSSQMRRWLWARSWEMIERHPLGIGWGRMYDQMGVAVLDSGYVQYPHNIVLEVASEAGWLAGALLVFVLWLAVRDQLGRASTVVESAMFALLVFALVNAMVSGDVNSNRGLWVAIGAALAPIATSQREADRLQVSDDVRRRRARRQHLPGGRVHARK